MSNIFSQKFFVGKKCSTFHILRGFTFLLKENLTIAKIVGSYTTNKALSNTQVKSFLCSLLFLQGFLQIVQSQCKSPIYIYESVNQLLKLHYIQ